MRVLVAMSGGVDSSVAAAVLAESGAEVVGATLKLWGGPGDSGCCSVADVEDARRVADRLGIDHHVFNFTDLFEATVVAPYVAEHGAGRTPNPCVECNRHVKFGALLDRAHRLGFDALATGHHARVARRGGVPELRRGADSAKDQSYVLSVLGRAQLEHLVLPVGELTKAEVRARAAAAGLATATKADSQEVCFIHSGAGRRGFLAERLALHPGTTVDGDTGQVVGEVPAVELVTVGQHRGLGTGGGPRRYALAVEPAEGRVVVGAFGALLTTSLPLDSLSWVDRPRRAGDGVLVQSSAHGAVAAGRLVEGGVELDAVRRAVAPGQTVALYDPTDPELVLGAGVAARPQLSGTPSPAVG